MELITHKDMYLNCRYYLIPHTVKLQSFSNWQPSSSTCIPL